MGETDQNEERARQERTERSKVLGLAHALVQGGNRKWDNVLKLAKESVVALVAIFSMLVIRDLTTAINRQTERYATLDKKMDHHLDEETIQAAMLRLGKYLGLPTDRLPPTTTAVPAPAPLPPPPPVKVPPVRPAKQTGLPIPRPKKPPPVGIEP